MMRAILMLAALVPLTTISATGGEQLRIAASPATSFAPTNLTIRTRLVPDQENRILDVVVESAEFYRSSQIPLEGERAPATIMVEFRDLPRGDYQVSGVLTGRDGERRAIAWQRVRVIAAGGE
jgi:hypothetical protein